MESPTRLPTLVAAAAAALLLALLLTTTLGVAPDGLGRANSSACLHWLEECQDWKVCAEHRDGGGRRLSGAASDGGRRNATRRAGSAGKPRSSRAHASKDSADAMAASCATRRLRHVLIVHEQHPQELGCDRRLLAIMQQLQAQGLTASLLYRKHVPDSMQSPRTARLAEMMGATPFDERELAGCLRPPPALYRYVSSRQLQRLASRGWFELVLVTLWFWNDPQPSFAELTLPTLRSHSPPALQPHVVLLVDDAHSVRAERLAQWETHAPLRRAYLEQASSLRPRQQSLYALADQVAHVSADDSAAEQRAFPAQRSWQLLRTPLRAMRTLPAQQAAPRRIYGQTRHIGFLGNGQTATNHQAVQWFLTHCWAALRAKQPALRLRLLGRPPGTFSNASGTFACTTLPTPPPHCGWAWGTPYAGNEQAAGIDTLGFLEAEPMRVEVLSWRLMIAPIRATTGINTKLLVAFELGVPLVATAAAAAPFGLPPPAVAPRSRRRLLQTHSWAARGRCRNCSHAATPASAQHTPSTTSTRKGAAAAKPAAHAVAAPAGGVAIADQPEAIVAHTLRLLTQPTAWKASVSAARSFHRAMMAADPAEADVRSLLRAACPREPRAVVPPFAPVSTSSDATPFASFDEGGSAGWTGLAWVTAGMRPPNRTTSACMPRAVRRWWQAAPDPAVTEARTKALVVLAAKTPLGTRGSALVHRVWWRVCRECALLCAEHPREPPQPPTPTQPQPQQQQQQQQQQRPRGFRSIGSTVDVWMDARWSPPAGALGALPSHRARVLRFGPRRADAGAAGHSTRAPGQLEELELQLPLPACKNTRSSGSMAHVADRKERRVVWRTALEFAGLTPYAVPLMLRVIDEEEERYCRGR